MKKLTSVVALAALLVLSGCSKTANLDGFKELKFDQTAQQVKALGFDCGTGDRCKPASGPGAKSPSFTLFGKTADVTANLKSGKVQAINVMVPMTAEETLKLLEGQYGKPKSFEFETFTGGRARTTYWLFGSKTALAVTDAVSVNPLATAYGLDLSAYMHNHTTVDYLGTAETDDLIKRAEKNTVNPKDS